MVQNHATGILVGLPDRAHDILRAVSMRQDLLAHDADPLVGILLLQLFVVGFRVLPVGRELPSGLEDGVRAAGNIEQFANTLLGNDPAHVHPPVPARTGMDGDGEAAPTPVGGHVARSAPTSRSSSITEPQQAAAGQASPHRRASPLVVACARDGGEHGR